jgi:hypothetical protein
MKNSMKNSMSTETLSGVPEMSLQQKQESTQTSHSGSSSSGTEVLYHCPNDDSENDVGRRTCRCTKSKLGVRWFLGAEFCRWWPL